MGSRPIPSPRSSPWWWTSTTAAAAPAQRWSRRRRSGRDGAASGPCGCAATSSASGLTSSTSGWGSPASNNRSRSRARSTLEPGGRREAPPRPLLRPRFRRRLPRRPLAALALPPRPRRHLLLGLLFAGLPDPGADRPARHPPGRAVPRRRRPRPSRPLPLLAGADPPLARRRERSADGAGLGRADRLGAVDPQPLAAPRDRRLPRPLPLLHRRGAGLRLLPVGRHAAR